MFGALVGANGAAFMQVWAMTHFAERGERTARPERLSLFDKVTVFFSGVNIPRPQNGRTPADLDLAYEMHRFASSNASPLEAWYIPGMDALPLIALFHGYAASKSTLLNRRAGVSSAGVRDLAGGFLRFGRFFGIRNDDRRKRISRRCRDAGIHATDVAGAENCSLRHFHGRRGGAARNCGAWRPG